MAECNLKVQDFVRAGRTGRRNALPDISSAKHIHVGTAGLSEVLESFSFNNCPQETSCESGGISGQQQNLPKGSST